jgi:hypothetical protein
MVSRTLREITATLMVTAVGSFQFLRLRGMELSNHLPVTLFLSAACFPAV